MKHKSHGSKLKTGGGGEERKQRERETTVPPLSTSSLAQTLDRYSATLLNIIMLMFGKCGWPEK